MRNEVKNVAEAVSTRNDILNTAAWALKKYINAGVLDEYTVRCELTDAALIASANGDHPLTDHEIDATITSGFKRADVATMPDRPAPAPKHAAPVSSPSETPEKPSESAPKDHKDVWGDVPPVDGAEWMFKTDDRVIELWGSGDDILWAEGEALMIAGGMGLGKSTLAGMLVRAQLGLEPEVLGMPVATIDRPILYLAMDRPRQIRRSMKRQFSESERAMIAGKLLIRPGPPINDMAIDPTLLARMAEASGAGVVYVDSLKDAAVGLSTDETGALYNRARQSLLAMGVNICELHHLRKPSPEAQGGIASVYGSTWLASGAGSVIILSGEPGDLVVKFRHAKTPANEVGPWRIDLNPEEGAFTVRKIDLTVSVKNAGAAGLDAEDAAKALYETRRPTDGEKKKAERQLDRLVSQGLLIRIDSFRGPAWFLPDVPINPPTPLPDGIF